MNLFLRIFFLISCGCWLGSFGALWLGYYEPTKTDMGFGMLFASLFFLQMFLYYTEIPRRKKQ